MFSIQNVLPPNVPMAEAFPLLLSYLKYNLFREAFSKFQTILCSLALITSPYFILINRIITTYYSCSVTVSSLQAVRNKMVDFQMTFSLCFLRIDTKLSDYNIFIYTLLNSVCSRFMDDMNLES